MCFRDSRIEIADRGHQIKLGDGHQIGGTEHDRIFLGFVVPFRDGEQHDIAVLTQIEGGRANEVADVLNEQDVDLMEVQLVQRGMNHVCIEMTGIAGCDLHCRGARGPNAPCIIFRFQVPLDHGH